MSNVEAKPEFCPNPACPYYERAQADGAAWYLPFGEFYTHCRGFIKRFRCRCCGKTCSTQTFSIHYWTHSTEDMKRLTQLLYSASGLRQIGRFTGVSYRVIQNRVRRLARNSLSVMDAALGELSLEENLAMDGFESYTRSQYHPNNFTTLVGSSSQFYYSVVHTLMRRKGSMSRGQKRLRALIDSVWRAPKQGIRDDCATMLADLSPLIVSACRASEPLRLYTDRHSSYPPALRRVPALRKELEEGRLVHHRVSSRDPRTPSNPLFSVNYLDRQIRKNMGEHVRETVKQGREVNCQMERMAVFMYMHNFHTPHRIDDQARVDSCPTHACLASSDSPAVHRQDTRFFTHRHIWGHCRTAHEWMRRIWLHLYENPPAVRMKKGKRKIRRVALPPMGLPAHFLA